MIDYRANGFYKDFAASIGLSIRSQLVPVVTGQNTFLAGFRNLSPNYRAVRRLSLVDSGRVQG
jgi:hypothetical protein